MCRWRISKSHDDDIDEKDDIEDKLPNGCLCVFVWIVAQVFFSEPSSPKTSESITDFTEKRSFFLKLLLKSNDLLMLD